MIGFAAVILGCGLLWLGVSNFRDYRAGRADFSAVDLTGLHPLWSTVFRLHRFNGHVDIWAFLILGALTVVFGIAAMLGFVGG